MIVKSPGPIKFYSIFFRSIGAFRSYAARSYTPGPWRTKKSFKESTVALPNYIFRAKCKHQKESVNTMTELTKTLSIRLSNEDKEYLAKYLNRESAESLIRQIKKGEIVLTRKGVVIGRVNTKSQSVNTNDRSVNTDNDGEWVREMAHNLNIPVRDFKRKIELSIYR